MRGIFCKESTIIFAIRLTYVVLTLSTLAPLNGFAATQDWNWNLPHDLSDADTKVNFQVDSTWHLINGNTSGIRGRVWLAEAKDQLSLRAKVVLPVARFDTEVASRDKRLREVMDSEHSPSVTLWVDALRPQCGLQEFLSASRCPALVDARLTIRGHEGSMRFTGEVSRSAGKFTLQGEVRFSWVDFGVEDPSILIAKLDPEVVVSYSVSIPEKKL